MKRHIIAGVATVGVVVAAEGAAQAQAPIPSERVVANNLTIFRWNPIGLENGLRLGYARKLYQADDSRALRDNFAWLGTFLRVHPAGARAAAVVELQPLSLVNLRASAEYFYYYGNFMFVQSRDSAAAELSDGAMKRNRDGPLGNYSSGGVHLTFEPLIQFKVGRVAVRSRALFGWFDMALQRGDRVWYEATLDTAVPKRGWVFANDLDVLWQEPHGEGTVNVGARYSWVAPQYNGEPGAAADNSHHRIGAIAAWTLWDRGYTSFNKPTVLAITSWYLQHRWRTGQDVSRLVPYFVIGFAFQSDLMDP